jgi:hypothetical protein
MFLIMHRSRSRIVLPLILLAYLLAQNGLALAQLLGGLSGHEVVSQWHASHYDVVMSHESGGGHASNEPACVHDCVEHHHLDIKPADPVMPDAKTKVLLVVLLSLLPALLVWLLPLVRRQTVLRWRDDPHRNTLSFLIRSTVLRH